LAYEAVIPRLKKNFDPGIHEGVCNFGLSKKYFEFSKSFSKKCTAKFGERQVPTLPLRLRKTMSAKNLRGCALNDGLYV
jgi:hypothetical protein